VLTELGYEKVDVSVVDLDENKEKALNIALNKIAGDWEHDKLGEILNELKDVEFNADELLKLTGFTDKELDNYITEDDLTGGKGTGLDDEDEGFNYKIMVECTDEMDQIRIIELLEEEDITCRPLVS
ncbi:MAG: hypothetical protein GY836_20670, partial [Herbaspirillum sp.]|nr:hypothetical protein [Herbaspirillum sp.]